MRFCHLFFAICLLIAFLLFNSSQAGAVSNTDQSCSIIPVTSAYTFLSHEPAQIFVPTKNTLDAISVNVKANIGQTANIKAEVINASTSSGQTIASKTQTISNTQSWVLFDFPDVAMPTGYYALTLADADQNSHAVWFHGPAGCYERGYAVYDNQERLDLDYRFAVNAYDAAGATPDASSQSSGTGSTNPSQKGSSVSKNSNSKTPSYADIIAQHNPTSSNSNINSSSQPTSPFSSILFFLVRLIPILVILFIVLVLIIIGLIVVFKKSKNKQL